MQLRLNKRSRAVGAALLVTAVAAIVFLAVRDREPVYEGKALSQWLEDTDRDYANLQGKPPMPPEIQADAQASRKAAQAICHIGPASLPTIERMLRTDSWPKRKFMELAAKQKLIDFRFIPQDVRRRHAIWACQALGETAKPVDHALVQCLDDGEKNVRLLAALALGQINGEPAIVVPALITACQDSYEGVRGNAAVALAQYGVHARRAVPVLVRMLNDTDPYPRIKAARTLQKIAPETDGDSVPILIELLQDGEASPFYVEAMEVLAAIGSAAKPAVPALVKALESRHPQVRLLAAKSVRVIAPESAVQIVPALVRMLQDPAPEAGTFRLEAASLLGSFGPSATAAVPTLTDALGDQYESVRSAAAQALKRIDPEAAAKAGIK